jgi:hypothetical protein
VPVGSGFIVFCSVLGFVEFELIHSFLEHESSRFGFLEFSQGLVFYLFEFI